MAEESQTSEFIAEKAAVLIWKAMEWLWGGLQGAVNKPSSRTSDAQGCLTPDNKNKASCGQFQSRECLKENSVRLFLAK